MSNRPPLVPELQVRDITRSLDFYLRILGCSIRYDRPEQKFAMIELDGAWIMLEQAEGFTAATDHEFVAQRQWRTGAMEHPFGRGINFEIAVSDVEGKYQRLIQHGYPIKFPMEERWYRVGDQEQGVRQFMVMDPDGYLLRLSQEIGRR